MTRWLPPVAAVLMFVGAASAQSANTVRLTTRNDVGKTNTAETHVEVVGNLKLGNFHLDVTDLTLPVAGIPVTVGRSYDTLWAGKSGDFGHGWRLTLGDTRLQVHYLPAAGLNGDGDGMQFLAGTRVVLDAPDGSRQGFTFAPVHQVGIGVNYWQPYYRPDAGNTATLTSADAVMYDSFGTGEFQVVTDDGNLRSYQPGSPYFGGAFTLKTLDGTEYDVDADPSHDTFGQYLATCDRNGNELTFAPDGITSNRGRSVTFERDQAGRISAVVDPRGHGVTYTYDATGDLRTVTDRAGVLTASSTYLTSPAHYLDTISDVNGTTQAQVQYDPTSGRMSGITDAAGQSAAVTYTLADPSAVGLPSAPGGVARVRHGRGGRRAGRQLIRPGGRDDDRASGDAGDEDGDGRAGALAAMRFARLAVLAAGGPLPPAGAGRGRPGVRAPDAPVPTEEVRERPRLLLIQPHAEGLGPLPEFRPAAVDPPE
jgi:YD repeat-containing protein